MEEEVQQLLIRFIGENEGYVAVLQASLDATKSAVQAIQKEAEKIGKASADASAKAAARTSDAAKEESRKARIMAEGAKVTASVATASERYASKITQLNSMLDEGAITQDTYNRATDKALAIMTDRDRLAREGQRVTRSVMNDTEKQQAQLKQLRKLYSNGAIDEETYNRASEAANITKNKIMAEGRGITDSLMTSEEQRSATVGNLNNLLTNGAITQETFNRGLAKANQEHYEATSSLNKMTSSMNFYVSALLTGVAAHEAWKVAKKSLFLSAESESMKAEFGVLLKNKERGEQLVKDIQIIAQTTALTADSLQHGAKTLLQFGVAGDKVIPTLMQIGDIAGGDIERIKHLTLAFGQMTQAGRLMGQDLIQMVNAGFNPLQEIARTSLLKGGRNKKDILGDLNTANTEKGIALIKELNRASGKTVSELRTDMENGLITVKQVEDAYKSATEKGGSFFEMLKEQAKQAKGMWANMKDDMDAALRGFGDVIMVEFQLKEVIQQMSNGAKDLAIWVKSLSPQTRTLLILISYLVAALTALSITLILSSFAMRTVIIAWKIGAEVLTLFIGQLTVATLATGLFKLGLIGLVAYGAYAFWNLASGASKTKREMEEMAKQASQIKENMSEMTKKDMTRIQGLVDVEQQLTETKRLLDIINRPKNAAGEFMNDSIGFWEEAWKKANDRMELMNKQGMRSEKPVLPDFMKHVVVPPVIFRPGKNLKELGLDDRYPQGFDVNDAIESEKKYMNFLNANLEAIKIRKGQLEELHNKLREATNASGQLSTALKNIKNELSDTINFAGMDKWDKQIAELNVLMEKLGTDPAVRRNTINEVEIIQKLAKMRELEGEADEYRRRLRKENMDFGKTPEEAIYDQFKNGPFDGKGLDEMLLARVRNAQRMMFFYKEEGRIRDEARKLNEEFKEPIEIYRKQAEDLKEMFSKGFINERVFNKGMDQALDKFNELTGAVHALKDALQGIQAVEYGSAEALGRMNEFRERLKLTPPVPMSDLKFDVQDRLPEWFKKIDPLSVPPKVMIPPPRVPSVPGGIQPVPMDRIPSIPDGIPPMNKDRVPTQPGGIEPGVGDPGRMGPDRRNDLMVPFDRNIQMVDQDRKEMLRLITRVAESNESMEKKPAVVLRTANL